MLLQASISLSCRFLQIKEVNQKFPQMTLILYSIVSKLDIFVQKKIYDTDTKSLIFQGYGVAGCSILWYVVLHQTILTIVY